MEINNDITLKGKQPCSTFYVHNNQQLEDTSRKKLLRKALFAQKKFYQRQVRTLQ